LDYEIHYLKETILFGSPGGDNMTTVLNYTLLQAKAYIYNNKINNNNTIDLYTFLINLKNKLKFEKNIHRNNNTPNKFNKFNILYNNL
jgi:hypothetical protein